MKAKLILVTSLAMMLATAGSAMAAPANDMVPVCNMATEPLSMLTATASVIMLVPVPECSMATAPLSMPTAMVFAIMQAMVSACTTDLGLLLMQMATAFVIMLELVLACATEQLNSLNHLFYKKEAVNL